MQANDPNKKQHWFLLSFMYPGPGQWVPHSYMASAPGKKLTLPYITAAKANNNTPENAVLLATSYMGYMSAHEIRGTSDKPVPTKMSDAYRQGMQAGLTGDEDVVNPYLAAEGMPDQNLHIYEWAEGLAAIKAMQASAAAG